MWPPLPAPTSCTTTAAASRCVHYHASSSALFLGSETLHSALRGGMPKRCCCTGLNTPHQHQEMSCNAGSSAYSMQPCNLFSEKLKTHNQEVSSGNFPSPPTSPPPPLRGGVLPMLPCFSSVLHRGDLSHDWRRSHLTWPVTSYMSRRALWHTANAGILPAVPTCMPRLHPSLCVDCRLSAFLLITFGSCQLAGIQSRMW